MKIIIISVFSIFFVIGCVEKRDLKQNTVVIDLESFPDGLHPTNSNSGSGGFIQSLTQGALIGIDPVTEKYKTILIKDLPSSDSSGLLYHFEISILAQWGRAPDVPDYFGSI